MYELKKSFGRKDFYKYQKSSYHRNFYNSSHYNYYKHNKNKNKYNYSDASKEFDDEFIFGKVFKEKNPKKYNKFEYNNYTPYTRYNKFDNKENISYNSNFYYTRTKIKTNDEVEINEINENKKQKNDVVPFSMKKSEDLSFEDKEDDEDNKEVISERINSENNLNKNESNFDVENIINDLIITNKECSLTNNERENTIIENINNLPNTQENFKIDSPNNMNIFYNNDFKNELNIQNNIGNLNEICEIKEMQNSNIRGNKLLNQCNFLSIIKTPPLFSPGKQSHNLDNLKFNGNNNFNCFINKGQSNFTSFNYSQNNITNFNKSTFNNIPISSFNFNEPVHKIPYSSPYFSTNIINNTHSNNNINNNPFNNMMSQIELNKCILKTQMNNNILYERSKENTDILEVNVKISKKETLVFKIRRYDDMFRTVKIFCEINKLDVKLIRPLIIYIIKALNSIYGIYNLYLKNEEIEFLKDLKNTFYNNESVLKEENKEIS